jgi:hypothetical protein
MNKALSFLFLGFGLFPNAGQDQGPRDDPRADYAESKSLHALKLEITQVLPDGKITVKIGNVSKRPVRIWDSSYSWGAAHWRVLRVKGGQVETFFQEVAVAWMGNWPGTFEIPGGERFEATLDLNREPGISAWHGLGGRKVRFDPGDMVIVVYDVPATFAARDLGGILGKEARGLDVWFGVAAACATVPGDKMGAGLKP